MTSRRTKRAPRDTRRGLTELAAVLVITGASSAASAQVRVSQGGMADEAAVRAGSHAVEEGETMWSLAERFLGNGEEWPRLWSWNPEVTNPHYIYPGFVVRLREGAQGGPPPDMPPPPKLRSHILGGPRFKMSAGVELPAGATLTGEQAWLDKDALKSVSRIIGSSEDHMLLSLSDEIYVKLESGSAPEPGKELAIFNRYTRQEVSPKATPFKTYPAGTEGEVVRVLGRVRIVRFDPKKKVATAVIIQARDPIERGHEVADIPGGVTVVAAKPNAKHVQGRIVAATRALGTLGQQQLVFIDAGSSQGVERGNEFAVVRQGDTWRKQLSLHEHLSGSERPDPKAASADQLPPENVAQLRVLDVRPNSSTALIMHATSEVYPGDRVEMHEGS
jgi:LysM domain